ncbi:hypothetical protein JCM18899A_06170 [Nocardioides sp. AN3]
MIAVVATAAALLVPTTASARATSVPECRSSDLRASFAADGGAAASRFGHLRLRNVSGRTCVLQGYGGLSLVGHGNGTQIGAAATRTPSARPRVTLEPGERAASLVEITSPDPFPRTTCRRRHADGFRVYVPDSHVAKFVPFPTVTCANPMLVMLQHKAYRHA